jgi:hypothetical protein
MPTPAMHGWMTTWHLDSILVWTEHASESEGKTGPVNLKARTSSGAYAVAIPTGACPHLGGDASKEQVGDAPQPQPLLQVSGVEGALARLVQQLLALPATTTFVSGKWCLSYCDWGKQQPRVFRYQPNMTPACRAAAPLAPCNPCTQHWQLRVNSEIHNNLSIEQFLALPCMLHHHRVFISHVNRYKRSKMCKV